MPTLPDLSINTGTTADDGTGDPLRTAFQAVVAWGAAYKVAAQGVLDDAQDAVDDASDSADAAAASASAAASSASAASTSATNAAASAASASAIALGDATGLPTTPPALLIDAAGSGVADPRVVCTRASALGTRINAAGALEAVPANQVRITHDPVTLECLGMLVEPGNPQGIRNPTASGASAPSTMPTNWTSTMVSGVTATVVGISSDRGVNRLRVTLAGTPSASGNCVIAFESTSQISSSSGTRHIVSSYLRLHAGALTNATIRLACEQVGSVTTLHTSGAITPTSSDLIEQRAEFVATTSGSHTHVQPELLVQVTSGQAINLTLDIGLPQCEKPGLYGGSTASMPRTADSIGVADVLTVSGSDLPIRSDVCTLYAESILLDTLPADSFGAAAQLHGGSVANAVTLDYKVGNACGATVRSGGTDSVQINTTYTAGASVAQAVSLSSAQAQYSKDGGTPTVDNSVTVPSLTTMRIGSTADAVRGRQIVRRVGLWRAAIGAAVQAVTA